MGTGVVSAVDLRGRSTLERDFALRWATIPRAPELQPEVWFHPARRWRFDFAAREARVAIELDGGIWRGIRGGHTSATGAARDREKDFEATLQGWAVVRLTADMARDRTRLARLADFIQSRLDPYHVRTTEWGPYRPVETTRAQRQPLSDPGSGNAG